MALFGRAQILGGRQTQESPTPYTILGSKLQVWWDFTDLASITRAGGDGSAITLVNDKSPTSVNGTSNFQLTNTGAPASMDNVFNGKSIARFDGVDDGLIQTGITGFLYTNGTTEIWFIARSDESGTGTIIAEGHSADDNQVYRIYDNDTTNAYTFDYGNSAGVDRFVNSQSRSTNDWDLVVCTDNGAATGTSNEVVGVDSGTTGAYTRDGGTWSRIGVGVTHRNTQSLFFDGDMAEILILASAASSGERTSLAAYFNTKYAKSWSPA